MGALGEFLGSLTADRIGFVQGEEYKQIQDSLENKEDIEAMINTRGWQLLIAKLDTNLEELKHSMLMAEEPADPVQAKIWRAERRAFAKAIQLLKDHVDVVIRTGFESIETLQDIGFSPKG